MTSHRGQAVCLVIAFLAMIAFAAPVQLILELRDGERPQITELFAQVPSRAYLRRFERELENRFRVGQTIRPWVQFARFTLLGDTPDKAVRGRNGWFFYQPAVRYLIEPWSPDAPSADIVAAIVAFRDDLAKRGIKLLVVPAPNKASIYPETLTARAAGMPPMNPSTRDIMAKLQEAGVNVVDLFEAYAEAKRTTDKREYYLAQDSHWSPEGIRLAADVVARRLLESGCLEKGTLAYQTRSVTIQRYGDVLRMMRMPQIERLFDPQSVECTQVVDPTTNEPYTDDPNSPVLVLGDSFLRIFERDEPGSAGFVAHLAHNLGFGLTALINDGGASTLVRQQVARKPALLDGKKIVVWEFVERDIRFGTEGWQVVPLP